MKPLFAIAAALLLASCSSAPEEPQWTTLFDGSNLDNFDMVGDANWNLADGVVQADTGTGFLVTKEPYKDFEIRVEFWADEAANSGVYLRSTDLGNITSTTAYEANIYDARPDQTYATASIVDVAPPSQPMKAANMWNTMTITAQGDHLIVDLNGVKTVDTHDSKFAEGPIALQRGPGLDGGGTIKFRKVEIRKL